LLPLAAVTTLGQRTMARLEDFMRRVDWFMANRPEARNVVQHMDSPAHAGWRMLSIVDEERLRRLLAAMLDPGEFLSDHGLRALSKVHEEQPLHVDVDGATATLDYEPGESTSGLFGGNSNWRGRVWLPINYLLPRIAPRLSALPRRLLRGLVPDGIRDDDEPRPGRGRAVVPPSLGLPRARGRVASGVRRLRLGRPGLARPDPGSTSTSTGTPGPGWARRTRRAGTGLVADLIVRRGRG
jgi:hypothetical protein